MIEAKSAQPQLPPLDVTEAEEQEIAKEISSALDCAPVLQQFSLSGKWLIKEIAEKRKRERQLLSALEVIREYRRGATHRLCCINVVAIVHGTQIKDRCATCIKADALLSPKPGPLRED